MSNVLSRARIVMVVFGLSAAGACASPAGPSAIAADKQAQGAELGQPSGRAVFSGLQVSALSHGVTDATLMKAGWACLEVGPGLTVCAPPGVGIPSIPPVPDNGGPPSYNLAAFVDHQFDHRVKFLRPDLFHGQPCVGGEPMDYFALLDYYHCIVPVR